MTAKPQHIAQNWSHVHYVNSNVVFLFSYFRKEPFSHTSDILVVTIKVM